MNPPPAFRSLSASTDQVVRSWPIVPFWLRRRASRETHLASPGAAVAATAVLAVLVAEPSLYGPGSRVFAVALTADSLAVFSLLAPFTTRVMLAGRQLAGGWRWAGWLPICGLFAAARVLADLDRAGSGHLAELEAPALQIRPRGIPASFSDQARRLFASFPARKGIAMQALLFGSHLGWLLAAASRLAEREGSWGFLLLAIVCLHLLGFAGAWLMTKSAKRLNILVSAHWADDLVSPCLLLPLPLNFAAIGIWFLPRARPQQDSLAAGVFGAEAPIKRLASFRQRVSVGGFATHFKGWNGDPFSRLAESRLRRELRWTEMHRVALFFQVLAFLCGLELMDLHVDGRLVFVLGLVSVASSCLHALLAVSGWITRTSRVLSGLGRVAGVSFAIALALAAAPVWSLPTGEAFGWLALVFLAGAALSILRAPLDVLVSPGRSRAVPAAMLRAMALFGLAIVLAAAGSRQSLAAAQIQLVAILAAGSFVAGPLLVYLAERYEAPAIVRSRWLCLPFSALLLPLLPSRSGPAAPAPAA